MNKINKAQLTKIHVLLGQNGWMKHKADIIESATNGRTSSSKELTFNEAKQVLRYLSEHNPSERLKSVIFSLAYRAEIIYGDSATDKKINAAKLNMFLLKSGTVKKELNKMDYSELLKTEKQFMAILRTMQKSKTNKEAEKVIVGLLDELGISTQSKERI